MKTLLRILASVAVSVALAVAGLAVVRSFAPAAWLRANNEVAGNYLQTLGTIYAVLLAFVVFVVWQQFNDARNSVESEANEISDLDRILQGFPDPTRSHVRGHLNAYVQAVVVEEWRRMGKGEHSRSAERALEEIWLALEVWEPTTQREQHLFGEALARYNDLSDARTHRLLASKVRLPSTMWGLLVADGALTIGSMWLFWLESFAAHALMTSALAGSIAFILYVVADLDNPFWGDWVISCDPIRQSLERRLDPASREGEERHGEGKAA
ncbi:MAG TPA: DUF4239 domain-containing protein [Myxococcales bacterium]|jgi:hypothetical protein